MRTIVLAITSYIFITLCLIMTGNSLVVALWLMGAPVVIGILAIPLLWWGFRHNYHKNRNLVQTVAAWQKAGRLAPNKPRTAEEDRLLQMLEWRMADIQRHKEHALLYTAGAVGTAAIGVHTAYKGFKVMEGMGSPTGKLP